MLFMMKILGLNFNLKKKEGKKVTSDMGEANFPYLYYLPIALSKAEIRLPSLFPGYEVRPFVFWQ
jgi:hypothetical protein